MYGILHGQKLKLGSLYGIESHMMREHKSKTNRDIDDVQTKNNEVIFSAEKLWKRVKHRIDELKFKRGFRKSAVVLIDVVMTASPEFMKSLDKKKQDLYLYDCLEFMKKKFGEKNIMYAVVHRDEANPHIHVGFMPITADNRLCAKELWSRGDLRRLQNEFHQQVCMKYGLERGRSAEDTKARHLSMNEYKEYKAVSERLEKYKSRESELQNLMREVGGKGFLSGKYSLTERQYHRLLSLSKTEAVAEHKAQELEHENSRLKSSVSARDDELKYERDVNETLRAKVRQASLYLNADEDDKQKIDSYLTERENERRKAKFLQQEAEKQARRARGDYTYKGWEKDYIDDLRAGKIKKPLTQQQNLGRSR